MKYICYVYYDEDWKPYYVGKGYAEYRVRQRHKVKIPEKNRIQIFYFEEQWQAEECEIELIGFWKRVVDGGCLLNQTFGGPGCRGRKDSPETLAKKSKWQKGVSKSNERLTALKRKPITLRNISSGEIVHFISEREAARQVGICRSSIKRSGKSKGWALV